MDKTIYLIRHCSAEGQAHDAELTAEGISQAENLVKLFEEVEVDRIISSPFVRARRSAEPLAEAKGIHIEQDSRLEERVLSSHELKDWLVKLEKTFSDFQLKYEGGESSSEAMLRAFNVVDGLKTGTRTVLVTHGNLMALLLGSFDDKFGFKAWQTLTNPDVFTLRITDSGTEIERIWG